MARMGKKRLVIDLEETEHAMLLSAARDGGATLSNYVRERLGLPLQRQGVKRPEGAPMKRVRKSKAHLS